MAPTASRFFRGLATVATAALLAACWEPTPAGRAPLPGPGMEEPADQIPWGQVGAGWLLVTWSLRADPPGPPTADARPTPDSPVGLYLLDPAGGRYPITAIAPPPPDKPGGHTGTPRLVDWSSDGRRALFVNWATGGPRTELTEVDLVTGAKRSFSVDRDYATVTYSRPGQSILVASSSTGHTLERFDLSGTRQFVFPTDRLGTAGVFTGDYLQTPGGGQVVLGTDRGMAVLGNDGTIVRPLPIPEPGNTCRPVRWWSLNVVLAACSAPYDPSSPTLGTQLWQVPLTGGAPVALTAANSGDLGYWNAWQVAGDTFVEDVPGCGGDGLVFRLNAGMQTTRLLVPGVDNRKSVFVVGVTGDKLVLRATGGCGSHSMSLVVFDPAANTATVVPNPPVGGGVQAALLHPAT